MTVRRGFWWGVGLAFVAIVLAAILFATDACGQSFSASGEISADAWASHDRCYQHTMKAGGAAGVRVGPIYATGFLKAVWWGACDAKIASSILNAENGRVIERSHGVNALVPVWRGFKIGATMRRRAVHHIWRNQADFREGGFPESGNAQTARARCRARLQCPTIGYHDHVRPMVTYTYGGISAKFMGPGWRWKSITLPYSAVLASVVYRDDRWGVDVKGAVGGLRESVVDAGVRVRLSGPVWAEGRYGTVSTPGWRSPLRRLAAGIRITL